MPILTIHLKSKGEIFNYGSLYHINDNKDIQNNYKYLNTIYIYKAFC